MSEPMTVCNDCQHETSGRCWRHRNSFHTNFRPSPEPQISGIPISKFGTHDLLTAEIKRLRAALEEIRDQDPVDLVLDPTRSCRLATIALQGSDAHGS